MAPTPSQPLWISAVGMCSSLGRYLDGCAAARAGLSRFHSDPEVLLATPGGEEDALTVAPACSNFSNYQGLARWLKLLGYAYQDLAAQLDIQSLEGRIAIFLAMPDPAARNLTFEPSAQPTDSDWLERNLDRFTSAFFRREAPQLLEVPLQCAFGDRVAFARALAKATQALSNGQAEHCLLLTVDSLLDTDTLRIQLEQQRLKTPDNPTGYIPGEGAAAIVLSAQAVHAQAQKCTVECHLDPTSLSPEDEEAKHALWLGRKLFALYQKAVVIPSGSNQKALLPLQITDFNGEQTRAKELGFMQHYITQNYPSGVILDPMVPALSFGETGTFSGALAFNAALHSIQRRYSKHNSFSVFLSEEGGKRSVCQLTFH